MKEIDFLPRNFHHAAKRRQRRRRLAVLAALVFAYVAVHLTYETRMDHVLASGSGSSGAGVESRAVTVLAGGHGGIRSPTPLSHDPRIARAEQAVLQLLGDEYRLRCLSIESGAKVGAPTKNLHGRLRAVAKNELAVGVLMGRLSACSYCADMKLSLLREVREDGKPMREFELTFTLDLNGISE